MSIGCIRRLHVASGARNGVVRPIVQLAAAKQREVRQRVDHAHKFSRALVNRYDLIAFEDLRVLNMVRSAKGTVEEPGKMLRRKLVSTGRF